MDLDVSIPIVRLVKSLRYTLKNMQGIKYSDYELIESINQDASLLYGRLSERFVYAAQKKTLLNVPSVKYALLSSGFVLIHQIVGDDGDLIPTTQLSAASRTYLIINDTIYAEPAMYLPALNSISLSIFIH